MSFQYLSVLAAITVVNAGSSSKDELKVSSDDIKTTACVNGKCTSTWELLSDEDMSTDCFTVIDSVWGNEYKAIDFGNHYLPEKSYDCIHMTGGTEIGKQGFGESIFDTFIMESSVTTVAKMAFKKVKSNTGLSMKVVQRCDPVTGEYTNVTWDERWNEETDPPAEIIKECPLPSVITDARVGKSATVAALSAGDSASIKLGTLAVGILGIIIGAGMM